MDFLPTVPDESVQLVVTSPPYDDLRTYEKTNDWNFEKFQKIAKELARVLID